MGEEAGKMCLSGGLKVKGKAPSTFVDIPWEVEMSQQVYVEPVVTSPS